MEIAALGITNLTDARYFSAMGVHWMGFDLRPDSPITLAHVQAIAEWVEGPRFMADVRGLSTDEIAEVLAGFDAAGLILEAGMELPYFAGTVFRVAPDDGACEGLIINEIENVSDDSSLWKMIGQPSEVNDLDDRISGVVISGGDEEQTGVKNYDVIDEIFDALQQL